MKRILTVVGVMVTGVAAAACSGGGGGGGKGLSSGTYTFANFAASPNTCHDVGTDLSSANGATQDITVSGNTVTFGSGANALVLTIAGDQLSAPQVDYFDIDWLDTAASGLVGKYDCQEHDTIDFSGTITAKDKMHLTQDVKYNVVSGTPSLCAVADNSAGFPVDSMPCEDLWTGDLAK
jgi:hypothetical protein